MDDKTEKPLKTLPLMPRKGEVIAMYKENSSHKGLSKSYLTKYMINLQREDDKSINTQTLTPKQFKEMVEDLGPPPGYVLTNT